MTKRTNSKKSTTATARERTVVICLVLVGLIGTAASAWQVWITLSQSQNTFFLNRIFSVLAWSIPLGVSVALALYPLRDQKFFQSIITAALWPLGIVAIIGYYYTFIAAPIITLFIVLYLPMLIWYGLLKTGLIPPVTQQTSLYVILVIASLGFVHFGERITRFVIQTWLQRKEDFSKLFALLRPLLVRVYTYAIMAAAYAVANLEKFSGLTFTTASWWIGYKEVLVEVLLTYVAVDSAIVTWRDYKSDFGGKAG